MRTLSISSILILMCTAVVANATTLALDDFSSGDENGGYGWGGAWTKNDGITPITGEMTFSTADPLSDGSDVWYRDDDDAGLGYLSRNLATPLSASTTPEVWVGMYLRPVTLTGWVVGMQASDSTFGGTAKGVRAGSLAGDPDDYIRLSTVSPANEQGDGTSQFTVGQETLMVLRFYKNSPTDTLYNRADLYADLDGTDGRYNNEVAIYTGYDLGTNSPAEIARLEMWRGGFEADFDYVAVGTTKESVVYPLP